MLDRPDASAGQPAGYYRMQPNLPNDGDSGQGEGKHLRDYVRAIYKRRWIATAVFVVVSGLGILQGFLAVPVYESTAQLLIDLENPSVVDFKDVVQSGNDFNMDYYPTQYRILQSRSLARRAIETHNLAKYLEAPPKETWSLRSMLGSARSSVIAWVKKPFVSDESAVPVEPKAPDETVRQANLIDSFLSGLTIAPIRNSRLVEIKYRSTDPGTAAAMVNALAEAYIRQNAEFRSGTTRDAQTWLAERLDEQRKKVEASEQALQTYRESHETVPSENGQNIVVQRLANMNDAVTNARTERIQKEALYRQLAGLQENQAALDTFPAILANSFIQQQKVQLAELQREQAQLSERLGDKHPEMVKVMSAIATAQDKLRVEITKVTESVRNEYLAAEAQEKSLSAALEGQKGEAMTMNRAGIEYGVLTREAESNRQIYQTLLQRANETGITGELKTNNVRLIDAAEVPRSAIAGRSTSILTSLAIGLVIACGFVFFLDYLDDRIKNPDDIQSQLGLPFVGMVPSAKTRGYESKLFIGDGAPGPFAEAFRAVRTSVLFSVSTTDQRSVVVTSTAPGEGKTVVSLNLAITLAQAGQRVLLLDADMRRPQVHERFGMAREPGLSNLIAGSVEPVDVIRASSTDGLFVVTAGALPPNPAELLSSKRFAAFLEQAQRDYDWVVLDTPPLMAVTDAAVVANLARNVLFVIAADKTPKEAARMALHHLGSSNAHIIGAVLNRVNIERDYYYYSKYYRRDYGNYYAKAPAKL